MRRSNFRTSRYVRTSGYVRSPGHVLCKGLCGKDVPTWVTPETCRYCADTCKCGQCGGPMKKGKSSGMCFKCYAIEYPTRVCPCGSSFTAHKSYANCENCNKKSRMKSFFDNLGEMHPDYVIKVKITGSGLSHSGYCSDPSNVQFTKVEDKIYFPAPISFVDDSDVMEDRMPSLIKLYKFNTCSCACYSGVTEYDAMTFKLVLKTPHMELCDWSIFCN